MPNLKQPILSIALASESLEALERREALYIRLLHTQTPRSTIAEQIYRRLTEVRLAMFVR